MAKLNPISVQRSAPQMETVDPNVYRARGAAVSSAIANTVALTTAIGANWNAAEDDISKSNFIEDWTAMMTKLSTNKMLDASEVPEDVNYKSTDKGPTNDTVMDIEEFEISKVPTFQVGMEMAQRAADKLLSVMTEGMSKKNAGAARLEMMRSYVAPQMAALAQKYFKDSEGYAMSAANVSIASDIKTGNMAGVEATLDRLVANGRISTEGRQARITEVKGEIQFDEHFIRVLGAGDGDDLDDFELDWVENPGDMTDDQISKLFTEADQRRSAIGRDEADAFAEGDEYYTSRFLARNLTRGELTVAVNNNELTPARALTLSNGLDTGSNTIPRDATNQGHIEEVMGMINRARYSATPDEPLDAIYSAINRHIGAGITGTYSNGSPRDDGLFFTPSDVGEMQTALAAARKDTRADPRFKDALSQIGGLLKIVTDPFTGFLDGNAGSIEAYQAFKQSLINYINAYPDGDPAQFVKDNRETYSEANYLLGIGVTFGETFPKVAHLIEVPESDDDSSRVGKVKWPEMTEYILDPANNIPDQEKMDIINFYYAHYLNRSFPNAEIAQDLEFIGTRNE